MAIKDSQIGTIKLIIQQQEETLGHMRKRFKLLETHIPQLESDIKKNKLRLEELENAPD